MKKLFIGFCSLVIAGLIITGCHKEKEAPKEEVTFDELQSKFKKAAFSANEIIKARFGNDYSGGGFETSLTGNPPINEVEAEEIVQPLIDPSASFLSSYYDINIYEYFSPGDPEIAHIGALGLRFKQLEEQGLAVDTLQMDLALEGMSFSNSGVVSNLTAPDPTILDCAMSALGVPAALIVGAAKDMSRKALLKAARKLASRTIGWIGLGIAIYEFGDCMDWW